MSKKTEKSKSNSRSGKIHPHDQCGICSKPKTYKAKQRAKELRKADETEPQPEAKARS